MANQYTTHPKDWASAVTLYRDTPTPAEEIARLAGCSLQYLYQKMNRQNVPKFKSHPMIRVRRMRVAAEPLAYFPADVDAEQRRDVSRRDAMVLAAHPRFRCGECGALATGPVCPNLHVINEYLVAS